MDFRTTRLDGQLEADIAHRGFDGMSDVDIRLTTLERTLDAHGGLLVDIKAAVTENEARRGPGAAEIIRTAANLATAGAIIAALLIYVITSSMQGPLVTLTERQKVSLDAVQDIPGMTRSIAIFNERLKFLSERLDSGEFIRRWETTVASNSGS